MEIYLLRHGAAEMARRGHPDSERALTEEGREALRRVMRRAQAAGVQPGAILSSPYRRAVETAEIAAAALQFPDQIERTQALQPEASPYDVWEEIRTRHSERAILLASHEPLMSSLGALLLGSPALSIDMKTATLLRVDCEGFGPQPKAVLKWMLTPAMA
jgi:phosphohistidine phosphatase